MGTVVDTATPFAWRDFNDFHRQHSSILLARFDE
jgi:hypothetical protein